MKKVIRDGKVAVLYSPEYGAGWYTWGLPIEAVFHPRLVELVEQNRREEITQELIDDLFCANDYNVGGARDLEIMWVDEWESFMIEEYDGFESIIFKKNMKWLKA